MAVFDMNVTSPTDTMVPENDTSSALEKAVYQWYTMVVITTGLVVNIVFAFKLVIQRRQFIFKPYLSGIIGSNIVFLTILALKNVLQSYNVNVRGAVCPMMMYSMSVTQHISTLCLAAIAVERYTHLYCKRLRMITVNVQSGHQLLKQCIVLASLVILCCLVNIWVIEMSTVFPQFNHICLVHQIVASNPKLTRALMLTSTIIVYFVPFVIATFINFLVIWRLFGAKKPRRSSVAGEAPSVVAPTGIDTRIAKMSIRCRQPSLSSVGRNGSRSRSNSNAKVNTTGLILRHSMARRNTRKKTTLLLFMVLMLVDMLLNFPNHFINIVRNYQENIMNPDVDMIAYILWHLQFIVSAMCVLLPLFRRQARPRGPSLSSRRNTQFDAISSFINREHRASLRPTPSPKELTPSTFEFEREGLL